MNKENETFFQKNILLFLTLFHDKILRPFESACQSSLSPLQFYSLCMLASSNEQPMTMTLLSQKMNVPKQHMTKVMRKLVQEGFAIRHTDAQDRRIIRLSITALGSQFLSKESQASVDLLCAKINTLSEMEITELRSIFGFATELMQKMP